MTLDDLYGVDPIESYSDSAVEAPKGNSQINYLITNATHINIITLTNCIKSTV